MRFGTTVAGADDLFVSHALASQWPNEADASARSPATSGLSDLDRIGVLRTGRPCIISGLPGAGATSLALGIARHGSELYRGSVLYVCDHLDTHELERRLMAQEDRLELAATLDRGSEDEHERRRLDALERLGRRSILLLATEQGVTPGRIAAIARDLERIGEPLRQLIIDRTSALRAPAGSTMHTDEVVASLLDAIAPHRVQTIIIEQPPQPMWHEYQQPEIRPNASVSPLFASLEGRLGSLLWVHRAEVFDDDTPDRGVGEIHVIWQRSGARGVVRAAFLDHLALWADLKPRPRPQQI